METLHIYNVFGDIESITSNKKSIGLSAIVRTGGYSNHSKTERQEHDYYATNPLAVDMLFELEDFSDKPIWECACGEGHLSKAMLAKGAEVYSSDLHDRGFGVEMVQSLDKDAVLRCANLLKEHNIWRRGGDTPPTYTPAELGWAIDTAVKVMIAAAAHYTSEENVNLPKE